MNNTSITGPTQTVLVNASGQLGTATASSAALKQDIAPIGDAADAILALRPVSYRYKPAYAQAGNPLQYGLIAEQVAKQIPALAQYAPTASPAASTTKSCPRCCSPSYSANPTERMEGPLRQVKRLPRSGRASGSRRLRIETWGRMTRISLQDAGFVQRAPGSPLRKRANTHLDGHRPAGGHGGEAESVLTKPLMRWDSLHRFQLIAAHRRCSASSHLTRRRLGLYLASLSISDRADAPDANARRHVRPPALSARPTCRPLVGETSRAAE